MADHDGRKGPRVSWTDLAGRRPARAVIVVLIAAVCFFGLPGATAMAAELPPGGSFVDDNNSVHEANIEAIAAAGITLGCNPPYDDQFCPGAPVSRAEMASFLARALDLPEPASGPFTDITGSIHETAINAIAAAGITRGCNPPANDRYCPNQAITRAEMATMLARALTLAPAAPPFTDLGGSEHAAAIGALAATGIAVGCNPPANDRFCPFDPVTREQMASFLARALGLDPVEPPDAPFHLMVGFTTHYTCCQDRVANVHDAADKINGIVLLPRETISLLDVLHNRVYSGNCQTSTTLFNAVWYAGLDEIEHRPHSVDFARYPQAIESTLIPWSVDLRFRNDTGQPLEIRAHYTSTSVTVELWGDNDGRSIVGDYTPTAGTVLDVVDEGGPNARIVTTETEGTGRTWNVTRTITDPSGSTSESWSWTYAY
jgi:hypothetical protein